VTDTGSGPLVDMTTTVVRTDAVGAQTVTVSALDWAGSVGSASCHYSVIYQFFFGSPIDAPPTVNTAKAGRILAVVWLLHDAQFNPVTDPNHFTEVTVRAIPCEAGTETDPVDNPAMIVTYNLA
jgi:hypothetical protein